jgi:hypothetical protein
LAKDLFHEVSLVTTTIGDLTHRSIDFRSLSSQRGTGPWIFHSGHPILSWIYHPAGAIEKLAILFPYVSFFLLQLSLMSLTGSAALGHRPLLASKCSSLP